MPNKRRGCTGLIGSVWDNCDLFCLSQEWQFKGCGYVAGKYNILVVVGLEFEHAHHQLIKKQDIFLGCVWVNTLSVYYWFMHKLFLEEEMGLKCFYILN